MKKIFSCLVLLALVSVGFSYTSADDIPDAFLVFDSSSDGDDYLLDAQTNGVTGYAYDENDDDYDDSDDKFCDDDSDCLDEDDCQDVEGTTSTHDNDDDYDTSSDPSDFYGDDMDEKLALNGLGDPVGINTDFYDEVDSDDYDNDGDY